MIRPAHALRLFGQGCQDAAIAAERALRAPLPVIRRIAFVSLAGGTGCTTASTRTAMLLAARRAGGVLHVDATAAERRGERAQDPRVETCVVPAPVWPAGVDAWRGHCDTLHRAHELTITDWGALHLTQMSQVAAYAHVVCLATTTERAAVQRTLDAAAVLQHAGTPTLLVASAVRGRPTIATRRMLASIPIPALLLPFDLTARRIDQAIVGDASALALAQLGAAVVRAATQARAAAGAA
ncbi:hypothetical protein [Propionicicella superfundia]|uniref:hypothetical protein n=1 Tax=Propionicicella superfundia TaxID=348582 RepID=UPI000419DAFC|nr:hypothetical protein [Propionicicella superfundia]